MQNLRGKNYRLSLLIVIFCILIIGLGVFYVVTLQNQPLENIETKKSRLLENYNFYQGPVERQPITQDYYYFEKISYQNWGSFDRLALQISPQNKEQLIGFTGDYTGKTLEIVLINLINKSKKVNQLILRNRGTITSSQTTFPEEGVGLMRISLDKQRAYRVIGSKEAIWIDIQKQKIGNISLTSKALAQAPNGDKNSGQVRVSKILYGEEGIPEETKEQNQVPPQSENINQNFFALSGEENVNAYNHIVAINIKEHVDPNLNLQDRINEINRQGGLAILAHPNINIGYSNKTLLSLSGYTGIEIYNKLVRGIATKKWDYILSRGKRVWGFAVDDAHTDITRGQAFIVMGAEITSPEVLLANLRSGNFYASSGAHFQSLSYNPFHKKIAVKTVRSSKIFFIGKYGKIYKKSFGKNAIYHIKGNEKYIRVEIKNSSGRAWSQPFWITKKEVNNSFQLSFFTFFELGNTHCHGNLEELLAWYQQNGYGFINVSQYNWIEP
jgi:hypothetical protein